MAGDNEIVLFQPDETTQFEARLENKTILYNAIQMAIL